MNYCSKCGLPVPSEIAICPCYTRAELLDMGIDPDCELQGYAPLPKEEDG